MGLWIYGQAQSIYMRKDFPGEYNQPAVAFHVLIPSLMVYHHHYLYTMVKSKSNLIPGINSEASQALDYQASQSVLKDKI